MKEQTRDAAIEQAIESAYDEALGGNPDNIPRKVPEQFRFAYLAGAASVSRKEVVEEKTMKTGADLITEERQRQVEVEGWTPDHDDEHADGELGDAAMCYIGTTLNEFTEYSGELSKAPYAWPWADDWWKPSKDPIRNLVKAGALIAAEIDRIQRQGEKTNE